MLAEEYLNKIKSLILFSERQMDTIEVVGTKISECILNNGIIHTFGSGHSDMIAKEITQRAGGLVPVSKLTDPMQGKAERIQGYAEVLLNEYKRIVDFKKDDIFIIISNSGRNALPIEMCFEVKNLGIKTVAITSLSYSRKVSSRHNSGKKLYEIADYSIDNSVEFGDALIEIPGKNIKSGAGSTISGALLINMLILTAIEKIVLNGEDPPILKSGNIDGADEHNNKLRQKYSRRIIW
jgi:uncharacterized phosphosugar-binding protein